MTKRNVYNEFSSSQLSKVVLGIMIELARRNGTLQDDETFDDIVSIGMEYKLQNESINQLLEREYNAKQRNN